MATHSKVTFIVDCPHCKAKVAAMEEGLVLRSIYDPNYHDVPEVTKVQIGSCPKCETILVAESHQVGFEGYNAEANEFDDAVRVYPKPAKIFASHRIPANVKTSLEQAERCVQAGAYLGAGAMLGRAIEYN